MRQLVAVLLENVPAQGGGVAAAGLVIDGGANIGQFALVAAALNQTVLAFEALAANAAQIVGSVGLRMPDGGAGLAGRIQLYQAGLADAERVVEVEISQVGSWAVNKGGVSLDYGGGGGGGAAGGCSLKVGCETVRLVPLDAVWAAAVAAQPELLTLPVRFLKLDIEGGEPLALRGAAHFIRERRPRAVAMELVPGGWA